MSKLIHNICVLLALLSSHLHAQIVDADTMLQRELEEYIITATRSERLFKNVAVPALVVPTKQIRLSGTLRLNEILQEQSGLFVTSGAGSSAIGGGVFGNGVQIQGLSPDYTLILLDGEPLIGRQGGVMDLSRFTVGNIRKIEIVKGPSSALYGSEAMGGVINIITEQRRENYTNGSFRYGSFDARDIQTSLNLDHKKNTLYLFLNYNGSEGYDLQPERPENTIDPFFNMAAQLKWTHRFTEKTRLVWNNRLYYSDQNSAFAILNDELNVSGKGLIHDINIQPTLHHLFNENLKTSFRLLANWYQFDQNLQFIESNEPYYSDQFIQGFYRIENQTDWNIHPDHQVVLGGGYNLQTVETIRYREKKYQHLCYFFAQNEWRINEDLDLIPGFRYDLHSDFANRASPKLALQYRIHENTQLSFSYGAGFKAPDFRQLYLYYINNPLGYQLFGASEFSLDELLLQQQEGLISRILPEAFQITTLRPEISHGFNAGVRHQFRNIPVRTEINIFYNAITDLINYVPVAFRNDGNLIFSYLNVRKAYTRGFEWNASAAITNELDMECGYQYLETADRDILEAFARGEVFGRDYPGGPARRLNRREYTGLFGRSPHMLQLKLNYLSQKNHWGGSVRAIYQSAWGINDLDGNGFANMPEEFAQGFCMLNASIQKSFYKRYTLQLALNILFNQIDPINVPQMPGTHGMLSFMWNFF